MQATYATESTPICFMVQTVDVHGCKRAVVLGPRAVETVIGLIFDDHAMHDVCNVVGQVSLEQLSTSNPAILAAGCSELGAWLNGSSWEVSKAKVKQ